MESDRLKRSSSHRPDSNFRPIDFFHGSWVKPQFEHAACENLRTLTDEEKSVAPSVSIQPWPARGIPFNNPANKGWNHRGPIDERGSTLRFRSDPTNSGIKRGSLRSEPD